MIYGLCIMLKKNKIIASVLCALMSSLPVMTVKAQEALPAPSQEAPGLTLPVPNSPAQSLRPPAQKVKKVKDVDEVIRKEAFDKAASGLMPMRPEEIRRFLEMYDETQEAVETPLNPDPKPLFEFKTVSLDPGQTPPEIITSVGHVTTVTFVDATGQPWPIKDISWAGDFNVEQPDEQSHMMRLIPMSSYAHGNMSMSFVDLATPVIFKLVTKKDEVQYRLDIRIPDIGPNVSTAEGYYGGDLNVSLDAGDTEISGVLDGSPPPEALMLEVSGVDGRTTAYELDGKTYLRTPHTLLSPTWDESVKSSDGMNVYVMGKTPVLLLSDRGHVVRAYLNREDETNE